MVSDIKFSIIIPAFNSALTLQRCLDSIISQDYSNIDLCIIDGGSTDDTLPIISDYQLRHSCIRYVSEKDQGIYDAMNKGIALAKGDWLYFMGSDDTLYNNNVLPAVAEKIRQSNAEVVYGSVMMRGDNKWNLNNIIFDGEYNFEKFIERNICHQAIFYKRDLVQKVGYFNLKYVTNADFDFNLRCFARAHFTYIDLIIANFFVGGQSSVTEDYIFHKDRGALLMKHFGSRIYTKPFLNARLYLQQAAWSASSPLNLFGRAYCLLAYIKLKAQSMLAS